MADRVVIPMYRMPERRETPVRRSKDNGARLVEAYFAFLLIVIVAAIVSIGAYALLHVLPALERSQSHRIQEYPLSGEFQSHSSERR